MFVFRIVVEAKKWEEAELNRVKRQQLKRKLEAMEKQESSDKHEMRKLHE